MKPLIIIMTLLTALAATVRGEDSTGRGAPSTTPEQLIEQLSSEDFEVRTAATAKLLSIGESVWPKLERYLNDDDAERVQRVRTLAAQLAVVRPDQQPLLKELIAKLENPSDDVKRAEGLDGMIKLGLPGIRALRNHLSGADSVPAVRLDLPHVAVTVGETIYGRAQLVNEGSKPFWRKNYNQFMRFYVGSRTPFGEERLGEMFGRCGGCGRRLTVRRGGYYNPIREWRAVLTGDVADEIQIEESLPHVGIYNSTLSCTLPVNATINPRIPDTTDTIDFSIGANYEQGKPQPSIKTQLFALPNLSKSPEDAMLRMNLSQTHKPELAAGETMKLTVGFTSRLPNSHVSLERDLARYAWYAILDGGVPVKWGSWQSVLEVEADKADAALKPKDLAPGASANWTLAITLPKESGTYTIVTGYERTDSNVFATPEDEFIEGPNIKSYDAGALYSSMEVTVGK